MYMQTCSVSHLSEFPRRMSKSQMRDASLQLDDRFGRLVALQLDRIAFELKPDICLRLAAARKAAVAKKGQN
jgi:Protein of unknown function (DUF3619)